MVAENLGNYANARIHESKHELDTEVESAYFSFYLI